MGTRVSICGCAAAPRGKPAAYRKDLHILTALKLSFSAITETSVHRKGKAFPQCAAA
jgi:hypothetical protein